MFKLFTSANQILPQLRYGYTALLSYEYLIYFTIVCVIVLGVYFPNGCAFSLVCALSLGAPVRFTSIETHTRDEQNLFTADTFTYQSRKSTVLIGKARVEEYTFVQL